MQRTHQLKILRQNNPQCHLYSLLMAMSCFGIDVTPKQAIACIGHDGYTKHGHHIAELLEFLRPYRLGLVVYDIDPQVAIAGGTAVKNIYHPNSLEKRFWSLIQNSVGIITNQTHAIAWDGDRAYDPNTGALNKSQLEDFCVCSFQLLVNL